MIRKPVLALAASFCFAGASAAVAAETGEWHRVTTTTQPSAPARIDGQVTEPYPDFLRILGRAEQPTEKAPFLGVSASPAPAVVRDQLKLPRDTGLVVDFVE